MRLDAVFKLKFPFEYWTLRVKEDGSTEYTKKIDARGMYVPSASGGGSLICAQPLGQYMQVRNLRDAAGRSMFQSGGEDYPMYVTTSEPQLDPFSRVIAYRHSLRRELPREYSQFISEMLQRG